MDNPPALSGARKADTAGKPKIALCRCGASANKPFCDGAHARIGFSSAADPSGLRTDPIAYAGTVEGGAVTVHYTPVLCTHAAQCQALAPSVFDPAARPWVQPGAGTLAALREVVAACPSGALRLSVGDGPAEHITQDEITIAVQGNGPYQVTNVPLEAGFNPASAGPAKYSLCRCGLSKNKPFCDGSHHGAKWSDGQDGAAAE